MKNRKIIVAFVLCACLIIGVAYAALVDQLTISGTGTYTPTNEKDFTVHFTHVNEIENVTVDISDSKNADMNVTLSDAAPNGYAILTITFAGSSDVSEVTIIKPTATDISITNTAFAVTTTWLDAVETDANGNVKLTQTNNTVKLRVDIKTTGTISATTDFEFTIPLRVTDDGTFDAVSVTP
ncbi:MAG: hypothetical protein IJW21_06725 [Clostridia bacterium]|nr:hypothetical protein [Clostridia bacterium]